MRILVIGADGFIGSALQRYFKTQGHDVIGTVFIRDPESNEFFCDITDSQSFSRIPGGVYDAVINASGVVDQKQPARTMRAVNARGVYNIINWISQGRCSHFIQLSSIAVYGLRTLGVNRDEVHTKRFRGFLGNAYMRTKARAEVYIEKSSVPCSVVRLPAVIGRGDTFFSPSIIDWLQRRDFFFCGSGNKPVSLLYAENLGPWIDKILSHGPLPYAMNCADFHVPWKEIIAQYAGLLNVPMPDKKKPLFSIVNYIDQADAHMLFTFSFFGSHFPSEALKKLTSFEPPCHWKEALSEIFGSL